VSPGTTPDSCPPDPESSASALQAPPKRQRFPAGADAAPPAWAGRYLEKQEPRKAKCGQHALNNVIGGPQFDEEFFDRALKDICGPELLELEADHRRGSGWYSHSVLACALQATVPPQWGLAKSPLEAKDYHMLLATDDWLGAIVNQDNQHWFAIVKHAGVLWRVDSVPPHLAILDNQLFGVLVGPRTAYVVHRDEGALPL